jgi:hypothetical protein
VGGVEKSLIDWLIIKLVKRKNISIQQVHDRSTSCHKRSSLETKEHFNLAETLYPHTVTHSHSHMHTHTKSPQTIIHTITNACRQSLHKTTCIHTITSHNHPDTSMHKKYNQTHSLAHTRQKHTHTHTRIQYNTINTCTNFIQPSDIISCTRNLNWCLGKKQALSQEWTVNTQSSTHNTHIHKKVNQTHSLAHTVKHTQHTTNCGNTDFSSTLRLCGLKRAQMSRTVVPGVRLQYSLNTSWNTGMVWSARHKHHIHQNQSPLIKIIQWNRNTLRTSYKSPLFTENSSLGSDDWELLITCFTVKKYSIELCPECQSSMFAWFSQICLKQSPWG